MGASVIAWCPGITEEQIESQPGFANDCTAWGDWMGERESHPDVLETLERLRVSALHSFITDGVDEADVDWVTPKDLLRAALRLRELVLAKDPATRRLVETYAKNANGVNPADDEFAQDLADVADLAEWARGEGATKMTLEANW